MVIALAETLARVLEQRNHPELDTIPLTFKGPQNERQNAVVAAFKHAWDGYKRFAWGHDNLKPMSGGFYDWYHLGLTIVDSLDTLYIMNLTKGYFNLLLNFDFAPSTSCSIVRRLRRGQKLGWTKFGSEKIQFGQLLRGDCSRAGWIAIGLSFEWRRSIFIESSNLIAMINV